MEAAICQLLLGRKAEALSTLGVRPDSAAGGGPDSGILDFVRVLIFCIILLAHSNVA